ncbi:MAG: filamentous hemagglutinin N-terminal domain-containing protein [Leptolyngbya sp. SIO3F4]|nr:filamentous hemagglutinin N-terminal domain-containing protein [Leptolyngbya sp. SIO3F4]
MRSRFIEITVIMGICCHGVAFGQVTPDSTLASEASTVTLQTNRHLIKGGAQRGHSLFHSFQDFNVGTAEAVYFANPVGVDTILSRVTGPNPSNILGVLGVEGTADLFLLNPQGIIFGPESQLDMTGSFIATTANSIQIDGVDFNATATQPLLLTVNVSPGVQYGRSQPGAVINNQGSLAVGEQQQLVLRGGTVQNTGELVAPGGLVELSGDVIGQIGTINTQANDGTVGTFLIDPQNILIQAGEPTNGNTIGLALDANNLVLQADNDITVNDDIASTSGNNLTLLAGRSVLIEPDRQISLNGGEFAAQFNDQPVIPQDREPGIAQFVLAPGAEIVTNGGAVSITSGIFDTTSQLNTAGASIVTTNAINGSGDITLSALGDLTVGLLDSRSDLGDGGTIVVDSQMGSIATNNDFLSDGNLQAGDIIITAAEGIAINGKLLTNSSLTSPDVADFSGVAGDITVIAGGDLDLQAPGEVSRVGDISASGLQSGAITLTSGGRLTGDNVRITNRLAGDEVGGDIRLSAQSMSLNETSIGTFTRDESLFFLGVRQDAIAGNVIVNVTGDIVLKNSLILTIADFTTAKAGDITLTAQSLEIRRVPGFNFPLTPESYGIGSISNFNSLGDGGDVNVTVTDSIDLIGPLSEPIQTDIVNSVTEFLEFVAQGVTIVTGSVGFRDSGTLNLQTGRLTLRDGAALVTNSLFTNSGDINIVVDELNLQIGSLIGASNDLPGQNAGDIDIQAGVVTLADGAAILTTSNSPGNAGDLSLTAEQLTIENGGLVASNTQNTGNGGQLTVDVSGQLLISGTNPVLGTASRISANSSGGGDAGPIGITAEQIIVRDGGEITTATLGSGIGANIQIDTRTLALDNGQINASTVTANQGGDILIQADESIEINGAGFDALTQQVINPILIGTLSADDFTQGILTVTAGAGAAGTVQIETPQFTARNGGLVATTTFGTGAGGDIDIQATQNLTLENALLATGTFSGPPSGDIRLTTQRLNASGGAQALTTTFGSGRAGDLTVVATESIDLIDPTDTGIASGLFASSFRSATGNGGDIEVSTGEFRILDGAIVTVSGEGQGNAGNIDIGARSLLLDQASIRATSASGEGGNITLNIDDVLVLRQGSVISTTAGQDGTGGNGGNIIFGNGFIVAVPEENSDITANAFQGNGGNIIITTQGLLGTEFRPQLTPQSDITASSQFGIDGEFIFEQTAPEPDSETVELPTNFTDADQIVAGCPADSGATFIVTGRGGLPLDPRQDIEDTLVLSVLDTSLELAYNDEEQQHSTQATPQLPQLSEQEVASSFVEAQGWQVTETGQVELIATADLVTTDLTAQCIAKNNHDT